MRHASTMLEAMRRAGALPEPVGIRFHSSPAESEYLSFAALDRRARSDAAWIRAAGWRAGDRALLVLDAGQAVPHALYAAFYAGLTVVPVPVTVSRNVDAVRARILAIAADCDARLALTTPEVESGLGGLGEHVTPLYLADAAGSGRWVDPGTTPDDVAVIQYTSGSTGTPKGVVVSHRNLVANQRAVAEVGGLDADTVFVGWLPHYHDMGLGMFMQAIHGGFALVFTSPTQFLRRPATWLRLLSEYRATATVAPDFGYALCARRVDDRQLAELDLSSVRTMITGAEPVRAGTLEAFARRFAAAGLAPDVFVPAYGMAETTLLTTAKRAGTPVRTLRLDAAALEHGAAAPARDGERSVEVVSCGPPAPGHRVAVVDPETRERRPDGTVGEVWVNGPSVARCYWHREGSSREAFGNRLPGDDRRRWLRTGDLGFLAEGELVVTGRLKDLIIVHGRNLAPSDLELACARALETTADCVQAAFEWQRDAVVVVAEVDPRGGGRADEAADRVREQLARTFSLRPLSLVLVRRGTIPRTTSGKVRRKATRELLAADRIPRLRVAGPRPDAATRATV